MLSDGYRTDPLAAELIRACERLHGALHPFVSIMINYVCRGLLQGHVCCDAMVVFRELSALSRWDKSICFEHFIEMLRTSEVVGELGDFTPFVLDRAGRFYLTRYAWYEQRLADRLKHFAASKVALADDTDIMRCGLILDQLFGVDVKNWQKAAAATAILKNLCVISGGPGTGKTTTVVKILAALQEMASGRLVIHLAAPTGKAAARMSESIRQRKPELSTQWAAAIPETASTLHRLLGVRLNSANFRYSQSYRLPLDVLVIDEVSMIDLALMTKVLEAMPDHAKLIMLGDRDQLASVEAGAVLGEIASLQAYDLLFSNYIHQLTGIDLAQEGFSGVFDSTSVSSCVMALKHSFRFGTQPGIGALVSAVKAGQAADALEVLQSGTFSDVAWQDISRMQDMTTSLTQRVAKAFEPYWHAVRSNNPVDAFKGLSKFRLLAAHREGEWGVLALNKRLEDYFMSLYFPDHTSEWYLGKPIMVLENDYSSELFNGDIGIALEYKGELRIAFESEGGGIRWMSPARLPRYENAYVMTVHKSQGSEFDEIVLLLPHSYASSQSRVLEKTSGLINRNVLYTGITRARLKAEIWGSVDVFNHAIATQPERISGLSDRLKE